MKTILSYGGAVSDINKLICQKLDRDVPKLICGYPLPCPHHTVMVEIPTKNKLISIVEALSKGKKEWN